MDYLLFSYPDCQKCQEMKSFLQATSLSGQELSLVQKEGKLKIREFLPLVKRDGSGAIILPTLVLLEEGRPAAVVNRAEELDLWLKSKP